ncbi:hypothetical protein C8R42DRAFT_418310 [Lentinula raphanica]|nr:hypothetical protein C8R42DRAFT_418310 [Lentinula raphanica]
MKQNTSPPSRKRMKSGKSVDIALSQSSSSSASSSTAMQTSHGALTVAGRRPRPTESSDYTFDLASLISAAGGHPSASAGASSSLDIVSRVTTSSSTPLDKGKRKRQVVQTRDDIVSHRKRRQVVVSDSESDTSDDDDDAPMVAEPYIPSRLSKKELSNIRIRKTRTVVEYRKQRESQSVPTLASSTAGPSSGVLRIDRHQDHTVVASSSSDGHHDLSDSSLRQSIPRSPSPVPISKPGQFMKASKASLPTFRKRRERSPDGVNDHTDFYSAPKFARHAESSNQAGSVDDDHQQHSSVSNQTVLGNENTLPHDGMEQLVQKLTSRVETLERAKESPPVQQIHLQQDLPPYHYYEQAMRNVLSEAFRTSMSMVQATNMNTSPTYTTPYPSRRGNPWSPVASSPHAGFPSARKPPYYPSNHPRHPYNKPYRGTHYTNHYHNNNYYRQHGYGHYTSRDFTKTHGEPYPQSPRSDGSAGQDQVERRSSRSVDRRTPYGASVRADPEERRTERPVERQALSPDASHRADPVERRTTRSTDRQPPSHEALRRANSAERTTSRSTSRQIPAHTASRRADSVERRTRWSTDRQVPSRDASSRANSVERRTSRSNGSVPVHQNRQDNGSNANSYSNRPQTPDDQNFWEDDYVQDDIAEPHSKQQGDSGKSSPVLRDLEHNPW